MGNLLSQARASFASDPKGPVVTDTDRAIVSIQRTRRSLQDLKRKQDMLAERSQSIINELLKDGNRDRALLALKKKKLHERNALQIDSNVLLLDERVAALETTAQQADLVGALKAANGAIKAMQKQMPLDDIEKLLQDNAESAEYVAQVNELLGEGSAAGKVADSELDSELDALEAEIMPTLPSHQTQAVASPTAKVNPDVATVAPGTEASAAMGSAEGPSADTAEGKTPAAAAGPQASVAAVSGCRQDAVEGTSDPVATDNTDPTGLSNIAAVAGDALPDVPTHTAPAASQAADNTGSEEEAKRVPVPA